MSASAYAGLVSRLGALAIDVMVIVLAVLAVTGLPAVAWTSLTPVSVPGWLSVTCSIAAGLLPWAYFTVSWWLTGQTLGDLTTGIVVRRSDGRRLSLPHAAARAAVGLLLAPVWLVGLLSVLWDVRRRAWHDRLLRTDVRYAGRP